MNCETYRAQWHERADGERSAADAAALDQHAAECDECRRYDAQMRAVFAGLDRLRDRPLMMSPRRHGTHTFAPLRVAAAIALFVGASWVLSIGLRERVPVSPDAAMVDADAPGGEEAVPSLTLTGESAKTYLAMAKPSSRPNVRMYWLYRVSEEQTQ
jgi:hypothetical protein